jgi:serine O-acetyltransferase
VLVHPGFHSVLLYRTSRWCYLHRMRAVSILINYLCSMLTGAQISHAAEIGKGLVIYHPHGIVVGRTAVLGEYCVLVHGNVIGQRLGGGDRPLIGDRFYAATGAKILGRIHIGNDVRVGANAVVLDSLPDGVTVAGNPARIVRIAEAANDAPVRQPPASEDAAVLSRVLAAVARSVETMAAARIGTDTVLLGEGVGVDSLEILRIVSEIEAEFDLTLDESRLAPARLRTVGTLAAMIEEMLSHDEPRDLRHAG